MASISAILLLLSLTITSASLIDDLNNLHPPPDFDATVSNNCLNNPSLRYCNSTSADLPDIFKSIIVATHLCNDSKTNVNCPFSFKNIDLGGRPNIALLYLSFTFFWKYCPLTVVLIDLSNNSIKGGFPLDVLHCSQVEVLDLSYNGLMRDAPLRSLSMLENLTFLNLSYNRFSESKVSYTELFKRFNRSSFIHSGLLPDYRKYKIKAVFLLLGFPIFVGLVIVFLGFVCIRRPDYLPRFLQRQHMFTPAMLKAATNGYSEVNLVAKIGELGIYRGTLRDGTEVRIEIYKEKISSEDYKNFAEECKVLVQLQHKNLVQVLGWCSRRGLRAIVIEWINGETIEMWLRRSPPWKQRLKVLFEVVEAMCYLQEQWPEVGYDLKTSSVLLSEEDREPLIVRFSVGEHNRSEICGFGLLVLEILTNKELKKSETGLLELMKAHYPDNLWKVIDERLKKTGITYEQATQVVSLALLCTDSSANRQPSLGQVSSTVTRIYESSFVSASPNPKKSHKDRADGYKAI
ncbi:hypothetical protein GIB67_000962 [Kingdonia uniflora]|uniref:Protein kinase domain-containing protein n=1 Tax=Kingdonia uniflora TaxID=39325 RepID=A0A7J7MFN2_9MAGN|nr:hypothetical protein GIB67_000962 [Kingdonia uniflora]